MQQQQSQQTGQQQTLAGLPKVKTPEFNDRDRVNDLLATEKYMTMAYNVAVNEASNETLHQTQMKFLNELHQCQRELYDFMHQHNLYKVDQANPQYIADAAQKFSSYKTQFPY